MDMESLCLEPKSIINNKKEKKKKGNRREKYTSHKAKVVTKSSQLSDTI